MFDSSTIVAVILLAFICFCIIKITSKVIRGRKSKQAIQNLADQIIETRTGYNYLLNRYLEDERKIINEADTKTEKAKAILEKTLDPTKKFFLQSFINNHKKNSIDELQRYYNFSNDNLSDQLDPIFRNVAMQVVEKQTFDSFDDMLIDYSADKANLIAHQLFECGIIDITYPGMIKDYKVLVNNSQVLNHILNKAGGHSLLRLEEKNKFNTYLRQRRQELLGTDLCFETKVAQNSENAAKYEELLQAYDILSKCDSKWEIFSSTGNLEAKSSTQALENRKKVFNTYRHCFNYVCLPNSSRVPYFQFDNSNIKIYLYPEYAVIARDALDFELMTLEDLNIQFKKSNYLETVCALAPKDAKTIQHTYKYVNKNGGKDINYRNNPRYPVYEYGTLTFSTCNTEMQFSNSEAAENFFMKLQDFLNRNDEQAITNIEITEDYLKKSKEGAMTLVKKPYQRF